MGNRYFDFDCFNFDFSEVNIEIREICEYIVVEWDLFKSGEEYFGCEVFYQKCFFDERWQYD